MKKSIVLCLALIVSLFAVTGSIAYFTDSVTANENVVASGNLDIEQFELERTTTTDADGNVVVSLKEWTSKAIYPAVGTPSHPTEATPYTFTATAIKDGQSVPVTGEFSAKLMDTTKLRGFVDKIVVVKNFGSLPVYVRTFVAVPTAFKDAIVLDWNASTDKETAGWYLSPTQITSDITHNNITASYTIYYATYNTALAAKNDPNNKDVAPPSLLGFHLKPDFKNTDSDAELRILVATEASQVLNDGKLDGTAKDISADDSMIATYQSAPSASRHPWAE